jgi:hypothetical protein
MTPPPHLQELKAIPGMLVDAKGQLVLVVCSEDAVGVSINRYDRFLQPEELVVEINSGHWITIERNQTELFLVTHNSEEEEDEHIELNTPQEHETAQFAIEIALLAWPEWSPEHRQHYKPTMFIPFRPPQAIPDA